MKNISGKTLIFYSFQQKKQQQCNVIAYQPTQQPIKIKDVLQQLPIDISEGKYHFRFKSQFFQGNQKIVGWIDINNLVAKVPLIGGSIYVKILKVKANQYNKLFNKQKLAKVGLLNGLSTNNTINNNNNNASYNYSRIQDNNRPKQNPIVKQVKQPVPSPPVQVKKPSINNGLNLIQSPSKNSQIPQNNVKPEVSSTPIKKGENIFQFPQQPKVFVNNETPQQKLKFFKQTQAAQQLQKQNQRIARDQLEQKITKWGYSGAKTLNNLTTLLSTLHDIWPEWPAISLTQLLKPQDCALFCKKALIKTHPDKNRTKPFRQRYLSKRVFELLNDAKKAQSS